MNADERRLFELERIARREEREIAATPEAIEDMYLCLCVCDDGETRACPKDLCERKEPGHLRLMHELRLDVCPLGDGCLGDAETCRAAAAVNGMSEIPSSATPDEEAVCHECTKRLVLKERGTGLYLPIHAHLTKGGMCSGSGSRIFLSDDEFLDSLDPAPDGIDSQISAKACEPKAIPAHVWRAAERIQRGLDEARAGNYWRASTGYVCVEDVAAVVLHCLAAPRSSE